MLCPVSSGECIRHSREGGMQIRPWATLMHPVVVATDAFLVVGIKARTTHRIEAVSQTAKIPALWRRFSVEDISSKFPAPFRSGSVRRIRRLRKR